MILDSNTHEIQFINKALRTLLLDDQTESGVSQSQEKENKFSQSHYEQEENFDLLSE